MQIYRATRPLTTGQQVGDIVLETDLGDGVAAILIEKGALAMAATPPLHELPGWKMRGRTLAEIGIETISELLDANEEAIMQKFNLRKENAIKRWRREALSWLSASAKRNCRRC